MHSSTLLKQFWNACCTTLHGTATGFSSYVSRTFQGWKIYIPTGKSLLLEQKDVTHCQMWTAGSVGEYMYGLICWDRTALCAVTKSYGHTVTEVIWGTFLPITSGQLICTVVY